MIRLTLIATVILAGSFLLTQGARAQTATPVVTTTPAPTTTVPAAAPATGFAPN